MAVEALPRTAAQVSPPLILRKMAPYVAAYTTSCVSTGLVTTRQPPCQTFEKLCWLPLSVLSRGAQVFPPSELLNMPSPKDELCRLLGSPVPM